MDITDALIKVFHSRAAGPFLFLGSGFSRRYIGLEDWRGLLEPFCDGEKPFEYYRASANGSYPRIASLISKDFNSSWWSSSLYASSVAENMHSVVDETSALRIEISNYLSELDYSFDPEHDLRSEIELLSNLNVDGIITTNWDVFIEQLFPDYKVYIG